MFGMGFSEILFIMVIAVIFLGPDKLPQAVTSTAKLFKKLSSTINEAKESIETELNIEELKQDALSYKSSLEEPIRKTNNEIKELFEEPKKDKHV